MKVLVQRVKSASVEVAGNISGQIGEGLLLLLGVEKNDTDTELRYCADKVLGLRIFADETGVMNISAMESSRPLLIVSQFTLCGNTRKGRRPSYDNAAPPDMARQFYEDFAEYCRSQGLQVETGVFRAYMQVNLINDGPVTFIIEKSHEKK